MPGQGERQEGAVQVRVGGRLTVSGARRLRGELLAALGAGRAVILEITGATEADLSFLQLVCAARRSAAACGVGFVVAATDLPDAVCRLVTAIGADGGPGDPARGAVAAAPRSG